MSRVAIAGLGSMGKLHVRVLNDLGVLHSVFDLNRETTEGLGVAAAKCFSFSALLDTKPDIVCIATPTETHFDLAIEAIDAGCDVFIEKPICDDLEEAEALVEYANSKGRLLGVGYIERFNPVFQALLKKLPLLDEITSVNIKRVGGIPRSASNVILDLMTHDFSLLQAIFKGREPLNIYTHRSSNEDIVNSAQVLLNYGRASATCEANWVSPVKIRHLHITGTGGYIEVDMMNQTLTQITTNTTHTEKFTGEPLRAEWISFLGGDVVSGEEAVKTLKLTLSAGRV